LEVNLTDFGGLEKLHFSTNDRGVYIVEGENAIGKSSFLRSFSTLFNYGNHKTLKNNGVVSISYKGDRYHYSRLSSIYILDKPALHDIVYCGSDNPIIRSLRTSSSNGDTFEKKIQQLLGYDEYNLIQKISKNIKKQLEDIIQDKRNQIGVYPEDIDENINLLNKRIKELEEEKEAYKYDAENLEGKKKQVDDIREEKEDLNGTISKITHGWANFSYNDEIITNKHRVRIEEAITQINELEKEENEIYRKIDSLSKDKEDIPAQLERVIKEKEEINSLRYKIENDMAEDNETKENYNEIIETYQSILRRKTCHTCERKVETKKDEEFFNVRIKRYKDMRNKLSERSKELVTTLAEYNEAYLSLFNKEIALKKRKTEVIDKYQSYDSLHRETENRRNDIIEWYNKVYPIYEELKEERKRLNIEEDNIQQSINNVEQGPLKKYSEAIDKIHEAKANIKRFSEQKKSLNVARMKTNSMVMSLSKLDGVIKYVDSQILEKVRSMEIELERSLNNVSKLLNWDFDGISVKNGKVVVRRKSKVQPLHNLSLAESSSISIMVLFFLRKLLAPDFPFFFIDDVTGFDEGREETFINFLKNDIKKDKRTDFCFITKTKKGSDLNIVKC
jgi:DNA repair exonuclease SbcCD ATPase subunit